MRAALPTDRMHAMAEIYRLGQTTGRPVPMQMYFSDTLDSAANPFVLVVLVDSADHAIARAIDLVSQRNRHAIAVAVLIGEELATTGYAETPENFTASKLGILRCGFDSIFSIDASLAEAFAERIARAIITPCGPDMHIGCDWNDMRTIVGGRSARGFDRYGIGRAKGDARASLAAQAAMQQIGLCPGADGLAASGLLMTIRASRQLLGSEVKQAMQVVRQRGAPDASIAQCIYYDTEYGDEIEVEIFEFGAIER